MNGLLNMVPIAALSESRTLFEFGLVVVLAAAAPLIGQVLRLPSILMLLTLGFGAGAVGALDPNALFGEQVISAVVSVAVGIILFEAGLGLKMFVLTPGEELDVVAAGDRTELHEGQELIGLQG